MRFVILTQCRCACVVRWYEGPPSAAPREGSSSRKTGLDFNRQTTKNKNIFLMKIMEA